MKKILSLVLILAIALSLTISAFALENITSENSVPNYELNTSTDVSDVYLSNIGASNTAFTNLFESFRNNTISMTDTGYSVSGVYSSQFPSYYAGAYINTDGELVILLIDSLTEEEQATAKSDVCQRAGSNDIVFGIAANSYSTLVNAMTQVSDYMSTISSARTSALEIQSARIDDYQNIVIAGISTDIIAYNASTKSDIESTIEVQIDPIFKSPVIAFEENTLNLTATSINCGSKITGNSASFSAGFRAKYTNSSGQLVYGIVTCGHAFSDCTSAVSVTGGLEIIGTLDTTRNKTSGKIDAAFIRTSSSGAISNKVVDSSGTTCTLSTSTVSSPEGGTVFMCGYVSGTIQIGIIQSTSANITLYPDDTSTNGVQLTDFYTANYPSQLGDSGGTVFTYVGGSSGTYEVAGIHSGYNSDTNISGFAKATNILSEFGLSIY